MSQYFQLLKARRFAPLFVAQFMGALNDNLFKTAVIVLLTFGVLVHSESNASILTSLAAGLFILPYILFSATGGILGDSEEKTKWMRRLKIAELFVVAGAIGAITSKNVPFMLVMVFLFGLQSALFSPFKYGILPQHLRRDELIAGNALIELGTFLAILGGSVLAALFVNNSSGIFTVAILLASFSVVGVVSCFFIPLAPPTAKRLTPSLNFFKDSWQLFNKLYEGPRSVTRATIAYSWYWFIGSILVTQLPVFVLNEVGGDEGVVTLLLITLSLGTASGALLCTNLLRGEITAKYSPFALFAMAVFICDLALAPHTIVDGELQNAKQFLLSFDGARTIFDLFFVSFFGGIYVIPLQVYVQRFSQPSRRAQTIAALNIWFALFVFGSAIFVMLLNIWVSHINQIYLITGIFTAVSGAIVWWKMPRPEKEALANAVAGEGETF